jgi:predicted enzyme related to lactoylglutathione lyase
MTLEVTAVDEVDHRERTLWIALPATERLRYLLHSLFAKNSASARKGIAMAQAKNRGRFVWQELMTDDTAAASAFYTKLLGWSGKGSSGDPAYTEFHAGAVGVGGMMKVPDSAKAEGARPMWMPYISSDSVDDSVKQIEGLGGKAIRPASDIPHVGRFAVVSDPQGAVFAVFTPSSPPTAPRPSVAFTPGEFSWQELATTDHEAAFTFYSKVFGWEELFRHDMGPMGTYLIFGVDGVQYGGMFKMAPHHGPHPFWLPYAAVEDVDASAKVASASNGRVVNGPMDVPGEGRIAQLLDPSGVLFAIHAQKKAAVPAGEAKPPAPQASAPQPKPAATPPKPAAAPSPPKKPAAPPAPAATATAPSSPPAAAPAAKPAPVRTPTPAPKPTAAAAATTVAAAPAAAKQVPAKKAPAKEAPAKKAPAKKKAVATKKVAKTKVVAKKKAAPKKKSTAKVVAKPKVAAAPKGKVKKHKKDKKKKDKKKKKKDKKKSKKERKKEKKARRKK